MIENDAAAELLHDLKSLKVQGRPFRATVVRMLSQIEGYDWTGIYRLEGQELVLDEFVGATTEHVRIPIGEGICGTAVKENRSIVVEDVTEVENYLACSLETKSEIVVLIKDGARILGQIDVDGHIPGQFDDSDRAFLEELAQVMADRWEMAHHA